MIIDRLKQYIDSKGITISAFERSIGMSNASLNKSFKRGKSIRSDNLEQILLVYPDINPSWLLTGKGEMLIKNNEASAISVKLVSIGDNIHTLRKNKGLTQSQLAGKLGVNADTISNYEKGVSTPDFDIVEKLVNIFNIDAHSLLFKDIPKNSYTYETPNKQPLVVSDNNTLLTQWGKGKIIDDSYRAIEIPASRRGIRNMFSGFTDEEIEKAMLDRFLNMFKRGEAISPQTLHEIIEKKDREITELQKKLWQYESASGPLDNKPSQPAVNDKENPDK